MIFITGASGLVGAALLRNLAEQLPTETFAAFTRQPGAILPAPNVRIVEGDLRRDDLGVHPATLKELQQHTTAIIHSAADIRFTSTLEEARSVNTEGTRRILDFAERCPRLEKMAHLSTLYVAGRRSGLVLEEPLPHSCGYFNVYTQTKHEAEALVLQRTTNLPISIFRLSSIIGNSRTGHVTQANYFHSLIRLMPRANEVTTVPGDPSAPIDLIADDWASTSLAFLFTNHFRPGAIRHICAGPARSLTARALFDLAFEVYNQRRASPLRPPQMIPLNDFAAPAPVFDRLSTFLPHLAVNQPFDPGHAGELLQVAGLAPPPAKPFVQSVIQHILSRQSLVPQGKTSP